MSGHGYGPYTRGCRCGICKAAKADYMAARRAQAYRVTDAVVEGITHGTRFGYEERGCRCDACVGVRRAMWRADRTKRNRYAWSPS